MICCDVFYCAMSNEFHESETSNNVDMLFLLCSALLCSALLCCAVLCCAVLCCLFVCLFAPFPARWPQFGGGGEPGPLGSPSPTAYAGANVAPAPRHEPVRSQLLNPRVTAN